MKMPKALLGIDAWCNRSPTNITGGEVNVLIPPIDSFEILSTYPEFVKYYY
jgi:hypothetical protein